MESINLQRIEARSWRSIQRTGLPELYVAMLLFALFAASLASDLTEAAWVAPFTLIILQGAGLAFYRWARQHLVEPRIGTVRFGPRRIRSLRRLRGALIACSFVTAAIVAMTALRFQGLREFLETFGGYGLPIIVLVVVGIPVAAIAYVMDTPRLLLHGAALIGGFFARAALEPILSPVLVSLIAHGGTAAASLAIGGTAFVLFLARASQAPFQEKANGE